MMKRALPAVLLAFVLAGCATASSQDDAEFDARLGRMMAGESEVQGAALDAALAKAASHPLGSEQNPVRASMPPGERAYLARLRCADGNAPEYERQGSGGDSPYGNIVDFYQVTCSGSEPAMVVMDMYHSGYAEDRPVPGFTIVER
ncbi:MAG: hypothetical protein J7493_05630 [Porphyrobacter sp.]|nr:hypothetical protein [Porphyrobacter sp.]